MEIKIDWARLFAQNPNFNYGAIDVDGEVHLFTSKPILRENTYWERDPSANDDTPKHKRHYYATHLGYPITLAECKGSLVHKNDFNAEPAKKPTPVDFFKWATDTASVFMERARFVKQLGLPVFAHFDGYGSYKGTYIAEEIYAEYCRQLREEYQVGEIVAVFHDGKVREDCREDYTITAKYIRGNVPFDLAARINHHYRNDLETYGEHWFEPIRIPLLDGELEMKTDYILILDDTKIFAQGKNGGWWEVNGTDFLPDKC